YYLTADGDKYTFAKRDVNLWSDRASAFIPLRYTANLQYEGAANGVVTSEAWNEYYLNGYHGELKSYKYSDKGSLGEDGNGKFDYATAIKYTDNASKHIFGLPVDVTVTGGDGSLYHHVTAKYNTNYANHITQITQQLNDGAAVTDYKYDSYGNIIQKTLPANGKGQRMWYKYRYEPEMNMYVERIDDAWGYRSEQGNFDYRYGIAKEHRDLNNFYYETDVDDLGRITGVRGPNELATGVPYAIAFEYQPLATVGESGITAPAYAVTKHYDIQHPNDDLETVTFVDGFGRAVQVKKDGVVTSASKGNSAKDENVMIVSGRNMYDAFGRVAKAFYPTTEGTGSKSTFNKSFDNVSPTVTVYDVLDRATSVTLPDNSTTTTAYTVDNGSHALVTTVTDALHNVQATHTNGSGKTLKTIQKSGPDGEITTSFEYDGIQRLVRVTDTEGNVTTSTYDMGDRRTEVNHPASGITSFTYDALGNVLTKQTANLAKEGKFITYDYDYQRLTGINYPDHPENNVKYYYGGRNASQNRIGRLMLREDGTGAIEYFYGKMGEVTKTRRTMIVPNQAIATYVTQWTYDSHNRLLEIIYPDEEKITYSYNLGGQLEKVHGYKSYGYDYVSKIGYDKFEQRIYLKYCNGAETFYTYDPQRRRLQNLTVNSGGNTIMDNAYTYDAVSNVLSVINGASVPQSGKAGGQMAHTYTYDALYRLVSATGTYTGADNKTASYTLAMGYDNMHRITSKRQILTQNNVQFNGTLNAGYDLSYTYGTETGKKFQLANVKDVNYRTEETPSESENVNNNHAYEYDANGNLVYVNTSRTKKDGIADEKAAERKLKWDEENRLLASDDNGFVTNYWYDADGERTVKTSGESDQVYVNSEFAGGRTNTAKFSLYVSPYLVANQGGRYTKHIYIGSQRVVSKIGDFDSYGSDPRRIQYAGSETDGLSVDYKQKYVQQLQVIKDNYATFAVPYNGEDNNDYVDGKGFCCNDGSLEAAQTRALARAAKNNFQEGDAYEKMQFYYHPDHLGSSSYITNLEGEVVQHIEYVPFGEVFIEERNNIWNTPYLFNAKEFDEETGLYYYGARYYEPRLSLWMSIDPLSLDYPNMTTYAYCSNNPIMATDVDGERILFVNGYWNSSFIGDWIGSKHSKRQYWGKNFDKAAQNFFGDYSTIIDACFIDGSSKWGGDMSGKDRYEAGYKYAQSNLEQLTSGLGENEVFNMVTHSEGSAYGAGVAQYLIEQGYNVNMVLHLSSDEGDEFSTPKEPYTMQLSYQGDWVTKNHPIKNADKVGEVCKGDKAFDEVHGCTKSSSVFKAASDLRTVRLQDNIGMRGNRVTSWKSQIPSTTPNGTNFYKINGFQVFNENGTKK
ncbi:RHS repeat-associated core domain-containing protein, partial [Leyella stercorea]|uniref:RHS repeat-associated core domain-containing protein n=1 Tax=Leyella stercorea TaxID=363265 RepID=UPI003AF9B5A2